VSARTLAVVAVAALASSALAVPSTSPEGELFGYPSLEDDAGRPLADSTMRQWFAGGRLQVRIDHAFRDGRAVVERARFRQGRELEQEWWSFEERRGRRILRAFEADLLLGHARAWKVEDDGKESAWEEEVKVEPGKTYAGTGLAYAVKNLRDRLVRGETVDLRAIVFLPKPLSVPVHVKHVGRERIPVLGRPTDADKFEVRPDLHGLEKIVEALKDPAGADIWLHHGTPPMLLRARFPLVEVRDPTVRIEVLGGKSAPSGGGRQHAH
jgi:hypothetical protein